jgi:hypothetical protein
MYATQRAAEVLIDLALLVVLVPVVVLLVPVVAVLASIDHLRLMRRRRGPHARQAQEA